VTADGSKREPSPDRPLLQRLLREPLLHFALLGAGLFVLYGWVRPVAASPLDRIVVSAGQVEALALGFSRVWQRPPTPQELRSMVDQYVEEEVLSREAIALGLDRDDTVIRRRLKQKMEFVTEDLAVTAEPEEAELQDWLRTHPEAFRQEGRTSFRHVYLGESPEPGEAQALLARLRSAGPGAESAGLGRPTLLPGEFEREPRSGVAANFGQGFAEELERVPPGEWTGPLQSAYGAHLVLVLAREDPLLPALDEVRERVRGELIDARRKRASQRFLEALLARYEVSVEWPTPADEPSLPTADR